MISYLYKKNYSGLAMKLVTDNKAQFEMSIESGNLVLALELAQK